MAWGWINYKKIREFYFGVNYFFKLAQWFIIYLTTSHCIHVLGEIKPWEWIIWCLHYLFSSFRILRNFSALVSTVLVFSCSLAASSSFNFSAFFKAVHWQGKVGRFFPRLSKCACMRQEIVAWRLNSITRKTILYKCRFQTTYSASWC